MYIINCYFNIDNIFSCIILTLLFNLKFEDMKKVSLNLKLTQLNKQELSERELNRLLGGETRCCTCRETSTALFEDNLVANYEGGESGLIPGNGESGFGIAANQ